MPQASFTNNVIVNSLTEVLNVHLDGASWVGEDLVSGWL
jgi:hypothetical protein